MELFYTEHIHAQKAHFSEEEARHITKAFRKRPGDLIYFTDGQGIMYHGTIDKMDKKEISVSIEGTQHQPKTWTGSLTMAFAPTKNFNRIEWLVEKLVEIGVDRIIPLETERSERKTWKMNRLNRIIKSAIKQSQKCVLPDLLQPQSFKNFCLNQDRHTSYFFGHCEPGEKAHLKDINVADKNVGFCIGPEGDFSQDEINLALSKGFQPISLGNSRLRTETAAFKMATAFQIQNDIE